MKKILFILGMIFSVYSFAEQGFSMSINDTESQYAINPFAFKRDDNSLYVLKAKPVSFLGVSTKDFDIAGVMIGFNNSADLQLISLIFEKKEDVIIFLDRLKRKFNIKDTYDNRYEPNDNCPQCFNKGEDSFCVQNRPNINKISVALIKTR